MGSPEAAAAAAAAASEAPATNGGGSTGTSANADYLVVFHAVSAGLNGPLLGSDEEDVVMAVYVVIDVRKNQVRAWLIPSSAI